MAYLQNATFEQGIQGWQPVSQPGNVTANVVQDGTAKSGSAFLRVSTTAAWGSIAQDWNCQLGFSGGGLDANGKPISVGVSGAQSSFGASAWIRAAPGSPPVTGIMTIWQLGLAANNNHPDANFTVGNDWTLVTNAIDLLPGTTTMRLEFYIQSTAPAVLDIDSVIVV